MNYSSHLSKIKAQFPKLTNSLLKESEFNLFENEEIAIRIINICLELCNTASTRFNINLNFAVDYNYALNAKATIRNKDAVVIFNLGLIEKIEVITTNSIKLLSADIVESLIISDKESDNLKKKSLEWFISYLFYHEVAHVLQFNKINPNDIQEVDEQNSTNKVFDIKNHIYELDADLFGIFITTVEILNELKNAQNTITKEDLYSTLSALILTIAIVITELSGNKFDTMYYKKNKHPHPLIRIAKIKEQILYLFSEKIKIEKSFLLTIFHRVADMLTEVEFGNGTTLEYSSMFQENFIDIKSYTDEIELKNISYPELTRYRLKKPSN